MRVLKRMLEVPQDLRLRGEPLGPVPLLLEVVVERVGVVHAFDVDSGSGVTVPVPGPTDVARGVERDDVFRQLVPQHADGVQTGESGSDDDRVMAFGGSGYHGNQPPRWRCG
jgi:hypothetical protein